MQKIKGIVKKGLSNGKELGWPTANIDTNEYIKNGVYAGWCKFNGLQYPSAIVVGAREETPKLVEAHLIGFEGDLLNKEIELEIVTSISEIDKFDTQEDLKNKIIDDIEKIKQALEYKNPKT